ncbi:MAG: hypothetical protein RLY70_1141 [Planctomycetota bacterium]|jgi:predicted sugar kinase
MRDAAFWRESVLRMAKTRGPKKSLCPSEIARKAVPEDWRAYMEAVRAAARELADAGAIEFLQGGQPVDPQTARGAIRLRIREAGNLAD